MAGLAWHNFVQRNWHCRRRSPSIRGLARTDQKTVGELLGWNLVRSLLYVLFSDQPLSAASLPSRARRTAKLSRLIPDILSIEGHEAGYHARADGIARDHQAPWHERRWIRQCELASPNENPTALSNFIEMLAMFLYPGRVDVYLWPFRQRPTARLGRSSP